MQKIATLLLLFMSTFGRGTTTKNGDRIIGGLAASKYEFPFQVSLRRFHYNMHFCGGSVITPIHILTAAHCLSPMSGVVTPPNVLSVLAGQIEEEITEESVIRLVSAVIVHVGFDRASFVNDIAMLKLTEQLPFNDAIATVPLRTNPIHSNKCVVSGWGYTVRRQCNKRPESLPTVSDTLLRTEVEIIDFVTCNDYYSGYLSPSMMCAGVPKGIDEVHDSCQGDSGGPLVCDGQLTGVVSTGCGCGDPTHPGIYTRVDKFYEWITSQIKHYSLDVSVATSTTRLDLYPKSYAADLKKPKNVLVLFIGNLIFMLT